LANFGQYESYLAIVFCSPHFPAEKKSLGGNDPQSRHRFGQDMSGKSPVACSTLTHYEDEIFGFDLAHCCLTDAGDDGRRHRQN
jgi:hypothetical protein